MKHLHTKLEQLAASCPCRWSVIVTDGDGRKIYSLRPDLIYPSASMIKVPILFEILRQAAAGTLCLQETVSPSTSCRVGGAGILKELNPSLPLNIRDLCVLMISLSDNTATNTLIERVGMAAVNQTMSDLGLTHTRLQRRMMDFAAAAAGLQNETTAADMAKLYQFLLNSHGLPPAYAALALNILKTQQVRDKIPFYLPESVSLAHKTGTLDGVEHDGGILYLPAGPYIVCIFADGLQNNAHGLQLIAQMGRAIYDALLQEEC